MNRKISFLNRSIALVLSSVICLPLFACKDNGDKNEQDSSLGEIPLPVVGEGLVDTGKLIVEEDGSCEYKILIPEVYNRDIEIAASELQYAIQATTGYTMSVTDEYQEGERYLSIGNTPLYTKNKQEVDADGLSEVETRIVTAGDDVIMKGDSDEYSLYATYEFMELAMGFKWFTYDTPRVIKSSTIKLYDFDYSREASVSIRNILGEKFSGDENEVLNKRRMKFKAFCRKRREGVRKSGHVERLLDEAERRKRIQECEGA